MIARHFTKQDGTSPIYIGKGKIITYSLAWPIPHDAPYKQALDKIITSVVEVRLKWYRDIPMKASFRWPMSTGQVKSRSNVLSSKRLSKVVCCTFGEYLTLSSCSSLFGVRLSRVGWSNIYNNPGQGGITDLSCRHLTPRLLRKHCISSFYA